MDNERIKKEIKDLLKSKTFIIAAAIVVIAAACSAYFLLRGNSAKSYYIKAERKSFVKYSEMIKRSYKDFVDKLTPHTLENSGARHELRLKLKPVNGPAGASVPSQTAELIGKAKIVIDTKYKPLSDESLSNISLLFERSPLIDGVFFTKNETMSFTIPAIIPERYLSVDLSDTAPLYGRLGLPVRLGKLPRPGELLNSVRFSNDSWDNALKKLGSILSSYIDDTDVRFEGKASSAANYQKGGKKLTVMLDSTKTERLAAGLSEWMSSNKDFAGLTYGNYANMVGLLGKTGIFETFESLEKSGAFVLNDYLAHLMTAMKGANDQSIIAGEIERAGRYKFPEGFKMEVLIDRSGNIIRRNASLKYTMPDGTTGAIQYSSENGDSRYNILENGSVAIKSIILNNGLMREKSLNIRTERLPVASKDKGSRKIVMSYDVLEDAKTIFGINVVLEPDTILDETTGSKITDTGYRIEMRGNGSNIADTLTGQLRTSLRENKKTKVKNLATSLVLKADMPSLDIPETEVELEITTEKKLGIEDFSFPDITGKKITDLNKASDMEIEQIQKDVIASFGAFYMNNKSLFDVFGGLKE